jgi:hypothetical protein
MSLASPAIASTTSRPTSTAQVASTVAITTRPM